MTPPDTIPGMIPGKGKHNEPYYAANGTKIENYGAIGIRGLTSEKAPLNCTMQVAGVNKPLVATIDMVINHQENLLPPKKKSDVVFVYLPK